MKEGERISQGIDKHRPHGPLRGDGQRKGQAGAGWRWAERGKRRTSVNVSTIKIKLKIKRKQVARYTHAHTLFFCSGKTNK